MPAHITEFLNRARWAIYDFVEASARLAPVAAELRDSPDVQAALGEPNTFSAPHDDIDAATVTQAIAGLQAAIDALPADVKAAIYRMRATKDVAGR